MEVEVVVEVEVEVLEEDGVRRWTRWTAAARHLLDARRGEEEVAPLLAVRLGVLHAIGLCQGHRSHVSAQVQHM